MFFCSVGNGGDRYKVPLALFTFDRAFEFRHCPRCSVRALLFLLLLVIIGCHFEVEAGEGGGEGGMCAFPAAGSVLECLHRL